MNFRSNFWIQVKKLMMFGVAAALVVSLIKPFMPQTDRLPADMKIPSAKLAWIAGGEGVLDPSKLEGKGVLLNFWATWCEPCRSEIPALNTLYDRYGGEHFTIIGITGQRPATVLRFMKDVPIKYGVARDPTGRFWSRFGVKTIPFSIFVGPDGRVVGDVTGELDLDDGAERIEALIAAAKAAR